MSANETSLLLRIRGDSSGGKAAVAETRAAVAQLRQSFGPELTQTVSGTNKVFSELGDNLNVFVSQRLPLVGGSFLRVTENISGLGKETAKQEASLKKVADSITGLSSATGKSVPQLTTFLTTFAKIEGQANRDAAAVKFFGAELLANNAKIIPSAEQAASGLAAMATSAEGAAVAAGGLALPIGIAVVAITALATGAALAAREIFQLSKNAAEFQGRIFDLSQQTGVAVETLSALEIQAKKTGGELGGSVTQAIVNFQRKLDDAQDPLSKTGELFSKFNIQTSDTESALRSAFTALAAMPEGFQQTNAAAELFGARGGKQILAILKETNGDLDGAIKRFREMGILIETDAARAADKFNDELALLDFQLRAASAVAAQELIPAFIDVIRVTGDLVRDLGPLLRLFSNLAGPVVRTVGQSMKGLGLIVAALTNDYKALADAIKESNEQATIFKDINPQAIPSQGAPGPKPVALSTTTPLGTAQEAAQTADAVVAIVKRSAAEQKQILNELFEQGRINRQQEAERVIAQNKKVLDADKARIQAQLDSQEQQIKITQGRTDISESEKLEIVRKSGEDVQKLQQQQLDAESLFTTTSREIRAKAAKERADSQRNEERSNLDNLLRDFDRHIKAIETQLDREEITESQGLTVIEEIERAKLLVRRQSLEAQQRIGFLTIENRKEFDRQIQALDKEAETLQDEQLLRRFRKEQDAVNRVRDIKSAEIDTTLELLRISGERTIAAIESQVRLRVKTEEDAAREILRIKLDLIDQEIGATEAKLRATTSIIGIGERTKAEAELNNQLKILRAQRRLIEDEGERATEEGRDRDIENARDYAEQLEQIENRIARIQRDTAQEVIDLMRLHFASRKAIINAQLQLDLADAATRHQTSLELIREDQRANDAQIRILTSRLTTLRAAGKETSAEYQKAVDDLAEANVKKQSLHAEEEAELTRSEKEKERILREARLAAKETDPIGRVQLNLDNLKEFASVLESTIVPLGEILTNTFQQFADALGQVVANWVLLGETGPAVMRKILAQALASLAAEAAVNAIKELALGFATLFFDPAESAAHFTSAALWGSIAGVAAIAGRAVAGDLFKQKGTGGGTGSSSRDRDRGQLNPLAFNRNQPEPQRIIVEFRAAGDQVSRAFTAVVLNDVKSGGPIRQAFADDEVLA
jgi:hypothetical protein